jgi:hypothetical protein
MRASLQRVLHALTGRRPPATEAITIGVLPSMRRRRGWARSVERLLAAAGYRPDGRQFRHPDWEAPLMLRTQVVPGLPCGAGGHQRRTPGPAPAHLGPGAAAAQAVPERPERVAAVR